MITNEQRKRLEAARSLAALAKSLLSTASVRLDDTSYAALCIVAAHLADIEGHLNEVLK